MSCGKAVNKLNNSGENRVKTVDLLSYLSGLCTDVKSEKLFGAPLGRLGMAVNYLSIQAFFDNMTLHTCSA